MNDNRPILYSYFLNAANMLYSNYTLSREQESSRNIGNNREYFINSFLNKVLPSKLKVDHGEIWDGFDNRTGQIDTIILRDDAPSLLFGTENTFLGEGVFAVIEVKSNLTRNKLNEALQTLNRVKNLRIDSGTTIRSGSYIDRPLRFIFAYEGATWDTLLNELNIPSNQDTVDIISILSRGVIIRRGLLLNWEGNQQYSRFNGGAAALGLLYYHLVSYATSFLGRNLKIDKYFDPVNRWGED